MRLATTVASTLRRFAFVAVSALIMVTGSERIFWYYTDATLAPFLELAVFYALPVYAFLWFVDRYQVDDLASLLVAVPVYGYVTEGVLTPILYSGGPTPFFPIWFSAWHGGLGLLVLWYLLRRWLVAGRLGWVLGLAIALGLFWGTWSVTMWLPENLNDPELAESTPRIRSALDFARYATITSAVLAAGHWVLGRGLWPTRYQPSPRVARALALLALIPVVVYTAVYVWALPMLLALLAVVVWLLRRHRDRLVEDPATPARPGLLAQLSGPVPLVSLAPLAALPIVASGTYAVWIEVQPSESLVRAFMYSTIAVQTAIGAVAMGWSAWSVVRRSRRPAEARVPAS